MSGLNLVYLIKGHNTLISVFHSNDEIVTEHNNLVQVALLPHSGNGRLTGCYDYL